MISDFVKHLAPEEKERRQAILAAENICKRCGVTAWSYRLEAEMQLVLRRSDPQRKEIVCGECSEKAAVTKGRRRKVA